LERQRLRRVGDRVPAGNATFPREIGEEPKKKLLARQELFFMFGWGG